MGAVIFSPWKAASATGLKPHEKPTKNQRSIQFIAFDAGCLDICNPIFVTKKIGECTAFQFDIGVEQQTELDGRLDVAIFTTTNGRLVIHGQDF